MHCLLAPSNTFQKMFGRTLSLPGLPPCPGLPRTRCASQGLRWRSTLTPRPPWIEPLPVGPRRRNFSGNQEKRSLYNVFFTELKYLNSFIAKLNRTRDKLSIFGLRENALFPLLGLIASERRNSGKKKNIFPTSPIKYLSENVWQNNVSARLAPLPRLAPGEVRLPGSGALLPRSPLPHKHLGSNPFPWDHGCEF